MEKDKIVAPFNKTKALVFEADMSNENEVQFADQLKKASKGTGSLAELIQNLVEIQRLENSK